MSSSSWLKKRNSYKKNSLTFRCSPLLLTYKISLICTAQKISFPVKLVFSKCDQIHSFIGNVVENKYFFEKGYWKGDVITNERMVSIFAKLLSCRLLIFRYNYYI